MKSAIFPSWMYRDPAGSIEGLIARSARSAKAAAAPKEKISPDRKDRYYTQSRSIHIRELVRLRKLGKHHDRVSRVAGGKYSFPCARFQRYREGWKGVFNKSGKRTHERGPVCRAMPSHQNQSKGVEHHAIQKS